MLENIAEVFRNTNNREFRILLAIENKMKFYEWVPVEEIRNFTHFDVKEIEYLLLLLSRKKLIHRNIRTYEGYRIYFEAYDLLALNTFVKRDSLNAIGDILGVGKESIVYNGLSGLINRHVAIKLHREGKMSFKQARIKRETIGERRHLSWLYASRLAAKKEYDALKILYPEVNVPEPIDYNRHGIIMSMAKGQELSHTTLDEPEWYLDEILKHVKKAYSLGIIHGDLSEFNIFADPEGCELIDWPQYITPSHANASDYLYRDVDNVLTFFRRKYGINRDTREIMNKVIS